VPAGDVAALARELVSLLGDPDRRAEMARTGRERVREELAWEHSARSYLAVVDRLSGGRPTSDGQPELALPNARGRSPL
jgi:glycosyltransferase involved in cell wall biosynthesis